MFSASQSASMVTAVLPNRVAARLLTRVRDTNGATVLASKARGSLLQESWWRQWLPAVSPAKTQLQMLVSAQNVERVIAEVVEMSHLHRQATGAVFSTPIDEAYIGSDCRLWNRKSALAGERKHSTDQSLTVTYCIVGKRLTEKIVRAAIGAGAHGPVVYHSEGRGLRDRLGWLRITKEHDKDVLMVIAEPADADQIFDSMARAGELHLPGRGFMYRLSIDRGLVNLPSRVSHHRYDANIQQVIRAVDHLSGHTHWRDQNVHDVGDAGRAVGLLLPEHEANPPVPRICLTAMVNRDDSDRLMELLLDFGAPGVNVSYTRLAGVDGEEVAAGARIVDEYAVLRCIANADTIYDIGRFIESKAEAEGITDICVLSNPVDRIATYEPGLVNYRNDAA